MKKRDVCIAVAAICAAVLLALSVFGRQAVPTGNWGLSFRQPGATPVAPADGETLKKYDAAYLGNTEEKVLYLTFDAGYENGCTEKILDTLKKHEVPAAFFLVGNYVNRNTELVRRMVAEGHTVGNHTLHHYDMAKIADRETFQKELQGMEALFREVTGEELPKYYRPPQGTYSQKNLEMAKDLGYRTVFWSLAYVDWNNDAQPTDQTAFEKLLPRTHNGAVILLHSTSQTNARVLDTLLTKWKEAGYRFETLDQLFQAAR